MSLILADSCTLADRVTSITNRTIISSTFPFCFQFRFQFRFQRSLLLCHRGFLLERQHVLRRSELLAGMEQHPHAPDHLAGEAYLPPGGDTALHLSAQEHAIAREDSHVPGHQHGRAQPLQA